MAAKVYLNLLFLIGILCQEIFVTLADEDVKLSSESLIRKRRVINHLPGGRNAVGTDTANYIVRIKEGSHDICAGAILSRYTVITTASCVYLHVSLYKIFSNAAENTGFVSHNITSKVEHSGNPPHHLFDAIALITVDPPFIYGTQTGHVELYAGPLPAGTPVTVYGWGNVCLTGRRMKPRNSLRKITLPIINLSECRTLYESRFTITEKHICTYDEQQYCADDDGGAALVYDNKLVALHIWKGETLSHRNPDIYIDVHHPDYSQWIRENTRQM